MSMPVFFFWVYDGKLFDYNGYSFTSHYFNVVTDGERASSSALLSSSAAAATVTPMTSILTVLSKTTLVGTPTSEPTNTGQRTPATQGGAQRLPTGGPASKSSTSPQGTGESNTTKIGIGVGVGAGVGCLLIGAAAGLFLRRRSSRREQSAEAYFGANEKREVVEPVAGSQNGYVNAYQVGELESMNRYGGFNELDGKGRSYELGT